MPFFKKKADAEEVVQDNETQIDDGVPAIETVNTFWSSMMTVFACGSGLFSDGYVNNVIGSVGTVLELEYGDVYTGSTAYKYVADIVFVGTVVGMLVFGVTADYWSRTNTLIVSTSILVIFTALAAGSYWSDSPTKMFSMLVAWRFFVGVGIGGEYPAGSTGCAEATGELKAGTRNRWFVLATNTMIDWGFVIGAFVPYIVAAACDNKHLGTIWRTSLGIGCVFPFILFFIRLRTKEPEEFNRNSMRHAKVPYKLALKFYGFRLLIVSIIWFLYDFSSFSFGLYSSTILDNLYDSSAPLTTVFGWNTMINVWYLPGTIAGAFISDWIGPKYALAGIVTLQCIVAFIMAADYANLAQPHMVGAFVVVYGIFLALGEAGPGDNIGLIASKTCATGIRGQYYGIAGAVGKIGAFVGTYVFPYVEKAGSNATQSAQYPFYVSACLCILSAVLTMLFIPYIDQDTITKEDARFRAYLEENGYDTRQLGLRKGEVLEAEAGHVEDRETKF